MTDQEPASPAKRYARELVAMSDAELDSYLERHCAASGLIVIELHDPENMPDSLIQRLRDRQDHVDSPAAATSLNLDEVNARLLGMPGDGPRPRRPSVASTVPATPPTEIETRNYNKILHLGGRPMYPITIISDVADNPAAYAHLVRPWTLYPESPTPEWYNVFKAQLADWEEFRWWQYLARLPADVEPEHSPRWDEVDNIFGVFARHFWPADATYTQAASKLLAHYKLDHPVPELAENPERQDKMTEWIEYIVFEYAAHYRYARVVARHRPARDEAWETITSSGLLRPHETEAYICSLEAALQFDLDREQLDAAVWAAESALEAASPTLSAPKSALSQAQDALDLFDRRMNLIYDFQGATADFRRWKRTTVRLDHLIKWAFQELFAMRAKTAGAQTEAPGKRARAAPAADDEPLSKRHKTDAQDADPAAEPVHDESSSKRRRPRTGDGDPAAAETTDGESPPKRRKTDAQQTADPTAADTPSETPGRQTRPRRQPTPSKRDGPAPEESTSAPPRRSTRISARSPPRKQAPSGVDAPSRSARKTKSLGGHEANGSAGNAAKGVVVKPGTEGGRQGQRAKRTTRKAKV